MKKIVVFLISWGAFLCAKGQPVVKDPQPIQLQIATDKTTVLAFPSALLYVDRGSEAVLAKPVREAPGKLLVKAARKDFAPTSLSVITEDGRVYSFLLSYGATPPLFYRVEEAEPLTDSLRARLKTPLTSVAMKRLANDLLRANETTALRSVKASGVRLSLEGIFIKEGVLFFKLRLVNRTSLPYTVNPFRFLISERSVSRRIASQEQALKPLVEEGTGEYVEGHREGQWVVALSAFTLPKKKRLWIELIDKGDGAELRLCLPRRALLQALPLKIQ